MRIAENNGRRFALLTKVVRVPVDAISAVRRSPTGSGALVVTDRGCNIVLDRYEEIVSALYGNDGNGQAERGARL